jgi:hypothetical protein
VRRRLRIGKETEEEKEATKRAEERGRKKQTKETKKQNESTTLNNAKGSKSEPNRQTSQQRKSCTGLVVVFLCFSSSLLLALPLILLGFLADF